MEHVTVWGVHTGRPRGSKESEPRLLAAELDRSFKGTGGRGTIAVGWPELGDLAVLPADPEAFRERLTEANPDATPQSIVNDATTLYAFVHEAKEGDIVVWRSAESSDVWIGRIRGPYVHDPAAPAGCINRRPVSWRPPQAATDFSKEALRSLGQQRSFFRVKNEQEFREAATGMPAWMLRATSDTTVEGETA